MARQKIYIGNLNIKLPLDMKRDARSLGESIGRDVLQSIAESTRKHIGTRRIDDVSVDRVSARDGAVDLRRRAVSGIVAEIKKGIRGGK